MKQFFSFIIFLFSFTSIVLSNSPQPGETTDMPDSVLIREKEMNELVVRPRHPLSNIRSLNMGLSIPVDEIKKIPNLIGDADPFKALQYIAGISQAGEANAGMHVRGGRNDQNLIMLNGIPVEIPTHIMGLFSIFNPDLMDHLDFIKAGIPAEYGGRMSSVVDIRNFINKQEKTEISGNIGLISSRLTAKIPVSDKFSVYASGRMSYIGTIVLPTLIKLGINPILAENNYEFNETNFGFNFDINNKTRFTGHYYAGKDIVEASSERFGLSKNSIRWGNQLVGLQLNHIFSDHFSMAHYLNMTRFSINSKIGWMAENYHAGTDNALLRYKNEFVYSVRAHNIKSGLEIVAGKLHPGRVEDENESGLPEIKNQQHSEINLFVRDQWVNGPLTINAGLRGGLYLKHPLSTSNSLIHPGDSKRVDKLYATLEPRLFGRYLINDNSSVKASVSKHFQHFNRLQVFKFGLPVEMIVTSSELLKPTSLWNYSLGYYHNFLDNKWELSLESFYKDYSNLVDIQGNINELLNSDNLENLIVSGKGKSYGAELMINRNGEKLSTWLSYILSKTLNQFDEINNGEPYLAFNDRRHDFSLVAVYTINKKLSLSSTMLYASGHRLNLPLSWYVIEGNVIPEYDGYNSFQMPDYHRIDVSLIYKLPPRKKLNSELVFSVYNLYNRANPFQVFFNTSGGLDGMTDFSFEMFYFLPVIPAVSWTFKI